MFLQQELRTGLEIELSSVQPLPLSSHLIPFPSMHSKESESYLHGNTSLHVDLSAELMTHAAPYMLLCRELVQVVCCLRQGSAERHYFL